MAIYNKKAECMSREEMRKVQSENLINLVQTVYKNVPFYKKRMDEAGVKPADIKSIDDIVKLPFTTKKDLRDNYPHGLLAVPQGEIVRIHASSGTTGKPTVVGYTQNDIDIWSEVMARSLVSCGLSKDSVLQVSFGYGLFTGGLGAHYGSEKIGAATIPMSSGNSLKQLLLMQDLDVTAICCTPSYAYYLAELLEKEKTPLSALKLRVGIFGAEPWSENIRKAIEEKLNIKAYDIYGLSEIIGPGVSIDCEEISGAHIQEDHFYPEIIDPETLKVLSAGEQGELVFTTLTKTGMPLIRYRTRDISALIPEKCKCGRTTVRMQKILGRDDDMLIIRGINVFPSQVESVILQKQEYFAPHYQIVVTRAGALDNLEVQVEVLESIDYKDEILMAKLAASLDKLLQSVLNIKTKITLKRPGEVPRSEGKAKRVVDLRQNI